MIVDTLNAYRKFAVDYFQDNTISLRNIACSFTAMVIKSENQSRPILDNKLFLTMDIFLFYCNSIGRMFGCHHAKNGLTHRKMVVDCHILITPIDDTLFQTKPDQKSGIFWQSQSFAS